MVENTVENPVNHPCIFDPNNVCPDSCPLYKSAVKILENYTSMLQTTPDRAARYIRRYFNQMTEKEKTQYGLEQRLSLGLKGISEVCEIEYPQKQN